MTAQYHLLTTRYLTRFRCLGGACEDTCCRDWNVFVDEEHYHALPARLEDPADRAGVVKVEGGSASRYALTVLRDGDRCCHFLDAGGLCTIHGRYGEDLLPDRCATYPRIRRRVFDRVEVVASMSCPEVARLVLLDGDALDRVPGDLALVGRGTLRREIDEKTTHPYEANFLPVRSLAMLLLRDARFPVASRFFFLAFLADASRAYLRRGAERFDVDAMQKLARALRSAESLAALDHKLPLVEGSDRFALSVMHELIRVGLTYAPLQELLEPLLSFYAERAPAAEGEDALAALVRGYRGLPPLPPDLGARLDELCARYATHELLRAWFVEETSFLSFVHQLLVRAAFVRFVVRGHAALAPPSDIAALDALVVRVTYRVARMLEGIDEIARELARGLEASSMSLGAAVSLIRV